jgi:hypothetical protein
VQVPSARAQSRNNTRSKTAEAGVFVKEDKLMLILNKETELSRILVVYCGKEAEDKEFSVPIRKEEMLTLDSRVASIAPP